MTNAVLDCIQKRRAIRSFTATPLKEDQVEALVDAALISPSAMNRQPWHLTVVQNQELLLEMERDVIRYYKNYGPELVAERNEQRHNKVFYNAPAVFFISVAAEDGLMDVGIMAQSIALAATSMGLGSVILGLPQVAFLGEMGEEWKKRLAFPKGYNFGIAVAVGEGLMSGVLRNPDRSKLSLID